MAKMQHWEKKRYSSMESYRESRERYNALRRERRACCKETPQCHEIHCPVCGKFVEFGKHPHIAFCSDECARQWAKVRCEELKNKLLQSGHIIREFSCRECGKDVRITDTQDNRTVFCSMACLNKYWDKVKAGRKGKGRRGDNLGMSGGMSLGSLIRREARDLR